MEVKNKTSFPGCPAGRTFKQDINGGYFHSMTDKEAISGKFINYHFSKEQMELFVDWFERVNDNTMIKPINETPTPEPIKERIITWIDHFTNSVAIIDDYKLTVSRSSFPIGGFWITRYKWEIHKGSELIAESSENDRDKAKQKAEKTLEEYEKFKNRKPPIS